MHAKRITKGSKQVINISPYLSTHAERYSAVMVIIVCIPDERDGELQILLYTCYLNIGTASFFTIFGMWCKQCTLFTAISESGREIRDNLFILKQAPDFSCSPLPMVAISCRFSCSLLSSCMKYELYVCSSVRTPTNAS